MAEPLPPRAPRSPQDRAMVNLVRSEHQLVWTGKRFLCRRCAAYKCPTQLVSWLLSGKCTGSKHASGRCMLAEAPFYRLCKGSQQVIDVYEPLLAEAAQRVADVLQERADEANLFVPPAEAPAAAVRPSTSLGCIRHTAYGRPCDVLVVQLYEY